MKSINLDNKAVIGIVVVVVVIVGAFLYKATDSNDKAPLPDRSRFVHAMPGTTPTAPAK